MSGRGMAQGSLRRMRLVLAALGAASALAGCYVTPVAPPGPPAVVVRPAPAPAACWHPGWWGRWGRWHPGYWGVCR